MHRLKKISLIKIFKILCFKDVLKSVALNRSQISTECIDNYPDTDQRRPYEFKSNGANFQKMQKDTKNLLIIFENNLLKMNYLYWSRFFLSHNFEQFLPKLKT